MKIADLNPFKWAKKSVNVSEGVMWSVGGDGSVRFHGGGSQSAAESPFPALTPGKALEDAGLYGGHSTIAGSIASMPLILWRGTKENRSHASNEPLYNLLMRAPNPKQTAYEWKSWLVSELLMHRNAFCRLVRMTTDRGRIRHILPIEQHRVKVEVRGDDQIRYRVKRAAQDWRTAYDGSSSPASVSAALPQLSGGDYEVFGPSEIMHFRLFSVSPNAGLPLLAHARTSIGLNIMLEEVAARFVQNGGNAARFFKTIKTMSPEAQRNFLEEMHKQIAGKNFGAMAMLVDGMDVTEEKATSLDKQQNLESRQFGVQQNSRLIGIPAHLNNDLSRSTNNNIEHQGLEYVVYRLLNIGEAIEQRIEVSALSESEADSGLHVEFDYSNFLRGDMAARERFIKSMFNIGAFDIDECRAEIGKNPLPEGKGKTRLVPVNMIELGKEPPANAPRPNN